MKVDHPETSNTNYLTQEALNDIFWVDIENEWIYKKMLDQYYQANDTDDRRENPVINPTGSIKMRRASSREKNYGFVTPLIKNKSKKLVGLSQNPW